MRTVARVTGGVVALVLCTGVASAHQVGVERFESPLPLSLLYVGAGVTVAATAGWLATSGRVESDQVSADSATARADPATARAGRATGGRTLVHVPGSVAVTVRRAARLGFLAAFVLAIWHGLFGPQVRAENVATVFVWSVWLKGVAILAAVVGDPWRFLSPWRAIYDALVRLEGREIAVLGSYPDRLGSWPAVVGFLLWIGVVENLTTVPRDPAATAGLVAAYALVAVLGAIAYGPAFLDRADALAVLYRLFGRVAPLQFSPEASDRADAGDWTLSVRAPWRGCSAPVRDGAVAAFVVAAVYTVSFDGFTNTPAYQDVLFGASDLVGTGAPPGIVLYLAGFALFCAAFAGVVRLASPRFPSSPPRSGSLGTALRAYAPTVVPIAVAYEVAHTYPFVVSELGRLVGLVGGFAGADVHLAPLAWLSVPVFWASQVVLIVGGHVVAVVASHRVAEERSGTRREVVRTHVPLTALMVGYTVLSLWIVSRPVVA